MDEFDLVAAKSLDFRASLMRNPARARQILANHIEKLILAPKGTESGPIYDVSGDIGFFWRGPSRDEPCGRGFDEPASRGGKCNADGSQRLAVISIAPGEKM